MFRYSLFVVINVMSLVYGTSRYEKLFDGTTLGKWYNVGGDWSVQNGEIALRNPTKKWGHLFTKNQYQNFYLKFKYKNISGNSGVYLRTVDGGAYGAYGLQVDIGPKDGKTQDASIMLVYANSYHWMPSYPSVISDAQIGQWMDMAIDVQDTIVRVLVNEKEVSQFTLMDSIPSTGKIAFQAHAGNDNEIYFKDVEIYTPGLIKGCQNKDYEEYDSTANFSDNSLCLNKVEKASISEIWNDKNVKSIYSIPSLKQFLDENYGVQVLDVYGKEKNFEDLNPGVYLLRHSHTKYSRILLNP